jgi:hypothetical protein
MTPDTKDRDARKIAAIDNRVMTENQFPEPGRSVLDWTSNLGKLTDSPECFFESLAIGRALA